MAADGEEERGRQWDLKVEPRTGQHKAEDATGAKVRLQAKLQ
jgi:hypothetical protein